MFCNEFGLYAITYQTRYCNSFAGSLLLYPMKIRHSSIKMKIKNIVDATGVEPAKTAAMFPFSCINLIQLRAQKLKPDTRYRALDHDIRTFFGRRKRTRTDNLRIMSPTLYHLSYPALLKRLLLEFNQQKSPSFHSSLNPKIILKIVTKVGLEPTRIG